MKSKYSKVKITALTLTFVCATTAMVGATTLQYGDKGKSVTAVQQQLIKHGYNATDKNGVYGKETKWAVRLFQQDRGLPVDGIVGPATYNALMSAPRSTKAVLTQNAATKAVATKSAFTNNNATSRRVAGQSITGKNIKLNNITKTKHQVAFMLSWRKQTNIAVYHMYLVVLHQVVSTALVTLNMYLQNKVFLCHVWQMNNIT